MMLTRLQLPSVHHNPPVTERACVYVMLKEKIMRKESLVNKTYARKDRASSLYIFR